MNLQSNPRRSVWIVQWYIFYLKNLFIGISEAYKPLRNDTCNNVGTKTLLYKIPAFPISGKEQYHLHESRYLTKQRLVIKIWLFFLGFFRVSRYIIAHESFAFSCRRRNFIECCKSNSSWSSSLFAFLFKLYLPSIDKTDSWLYIYS